MRAAPTASELRATFEAAGSWTVGIEEELMIVDPESGALLDAADAVLDATAGDPRFKTELPASQVEIVLPPATGVAEATRALARARGDLLAAVEGRFGFLAAGLHPAPCPAAGLTDADSYRPLIAEYGQIARRQLVAALQIHVAIGDADLALGVYDALRSYLPEISALAANSPFHDGADTGMASFRAKIAEGLPRQGVPPAFGTWEALSAALSWTRSATGFGSETWWWEMRLHPAFGTIELRAPDTQSTLADASGVVAFVVALVHRLSRRLDAGERLPVHETWRIDENRWSANRHGLEGEIADLESGERIPTRRRVLDLIEAVSDSARALGCASELREATRLVGEGGGAARQRAVAARIGLEALPAWIASRLLDGPG